MDTRPGALEIWPAHAEGPEPPRLGPEHPQKHLQFLPKGNYKPKFLGQLEGFLKKELRALGCSESRPSEKRLQVKLYSKLKFILPGIYLVVLLAINLLIEYLVLSVPISFLEYTIS